AESSSTHMLIWVRVCSMRSSSAIASWRSCGLSSAIVVQRAREVARLDLVDRGSRALLLLLGQRWGARRAVITLGALQRVLDLGDRGLDGVGLPQDPLGGPDAQMITMAEIMREP